MPDLILTLHNLTSISAVLLCWWVSHQFAQATPPGRFIAAMFGMLGLSILITMFARNVEPLTPEALIIGSKAALTLCLLGVAIRNHLAGKDAAELPPPNDSPSWRHAALNAETRAEALARAVINGNAARAKAFAKAILRGHRR
ncbi:hypothetical protein ACXN5S_16310 [Pseudoroseicyclus sp. H15]